MPFLPVHLLLELRGGCLETSESLRVLLRDKLWIDEKWPEQIRVARVKRHVHFNSQNHWINITGDSSLAVLPHLLLPNNVALHHAVKGLKHLLQDSHDLPRHFDGLDNDSTVHPFVPALRYLLRGCQTAAAVWMRGLRLLHTLTHAVIRQPPDEHHLPVELNQENPVKRRKNRARVILSLPPTCSDPYRPTQRPHCNQTLRIARLRYCEYVSVVINSK